MQCIDKFDGDVLQGGITRRVVYSIVVLIHPAYACGHVAQRQSLIAPIKSYLILSYMQQGAKISKSYSYNFYPI